MQSRHKDALYALAVLGIFILEAAALGALFWAFLFEEPSLTHEKLGDLGRALVGFVALMALLLGLVTALILISQAVGTRRARRHAAGAAAWREVWSEVLFAGRPPPEDPLAPDAVEALLDLREELAGGEGALVGRVITEHGVDQQLLRRVGPPRSGGRRRRALRRGHRRGRLADRLDALEGLAKARVPTALVSLVLLLDDDETAIRRMAARAAGRTMAEMSPGPELAESAQVLSAALGRDVLPRGVVEETILLLGDNAPAVIASLLETSGSEALTVTALDCAGKLKATELAPRIGVYLDPAHHAELRAAALRACGAMSLLVEGAAEELQASLDDDHEFVRVQATHTAILLPMDTALEALRGRLEDPSWWVRRAAALGLARLGPPGRELLESVGRSTGDRFAREMAVLVLQDGGWLDPHRARSLLAAS